MRKFLLTLIAVLIFASPSFAWLGKTGTVNTIAGPLTVTENSADIIFGHDGTSAYIYAGTLASPDDIEFYPDITTGNPSVKIYGYDTGASALKKGRLQVDASGIFNISADGRIDFAPAGTVVLKVHYNWIEVGKRMYFLDNTPLNFGSSEDASIEWDTGQTNDALLLGLGASNTLIITEKADMGTDFGLAVQTNPTLFIFDAGATGYLSLTHNGTSARVYAGTLTAPHDIEFYPDITTGNPSVKIYGYDTGASAVKYGRLYVDSTGNFVLAAQERIDFNPGGLTVMKLYNNSLEFDKDAYVVDNVRLYFGNAADAALEWDTGQTNDALLLGLGASNTFIVCEKADMSTDFALATQTDPTLFLVTADTTKTIGINANHSAITTAGTLSYQIPVLINGTTYYLYAYTSGT
jgi:hypothetical protein